MRVPITVLAVSLLAIPSAMAQTRGELLYTTHCISCHTAEMHWRDKRSANSWPALTAQVRRWQDTASLAWNDSDILAVSRYLNDAFYHFDVTASTACLLRLDGDGPVSAPTFLNRSASVLPGWLVKR